MDKASTVATVLLGAILPVCVSSCSRDERAGGQKAGSQPNVLLITLDTTRADHIGAYGCTYAYTPTLDALAQQSVRFERAFAPTPETLPSHTSILTGVYPFYHGVRDNSHFVANPALNTLAETFKQAGYQTAAVVAAFVLDSRFGLDQGFDIYDDKVASVSESARFTVPERNAAAVTDAALNWLGTVATDRPFFLWIHYYDPHAVYAAPESFTKYQGHPYDVEIAYTDDELGRLLKFVGEFTAGGRRTLTVFTADHGEALGEYGERTHAYFVYDSTLHVPLLIRLPDGSHAGREIDVPVGLVDLMPTILDVVGLPVPDANHIHGRSLLPLLQAEEMPAGFLDRPIAFESYEPHYSYGWAPVQGIRVGGTKFIDSPVPELYVLSENPKEIPSANRYAERPQLVAELEATYHDLFESRLSFPPFTAAAQAPDSDVIERLRALGYVASTIPDEPSASPGRDLKDMLPFYTQILNSMAMITNGASQAAAQALAGLFREDPENRTVLWMLAELGATTPAVADEVLPLLEDALDNGRIVPDMVPQILVNCGRMYLAKENDEGALKCFGDARKIEQDYAAAHWWWGVTCLRIGRLAEAVDALSRAAELFGPAVDHCHLALGLALFADGRTEQAVQEWDGVLSRRDQTPMAVWRAAAACPLDAAIAERVSPALRRAIDKPLPPRVASAVGIVYAKSLTLLHAFEPAIAAFEKVRSLLPKDDPTLELSLAGLHQRLGRTAQARAHIARAYDIAPERGDVVNAQAALLEETGDLEGAVKLIDSYYQAHPDSVDVANNLAWMLARQGQDLDRALKLAKRIVQRHPGSATLNDTLGWIYHLRGDREMAIHFLARAVEIEPRNATHQYHLGSACRAAGQLDSAREAFAKAVELAPTPRPRWYDEAKAASPIP